MAITIYPFIPRFMSPCYNHPLSLEISKTVYRTKLQTNSIIILVTMRLPKFSTNFLGHLFFIFTFGFLLGYSFGLFQSLTKPLFVIASLTGIAFIHELPTTGNLCPVAVQPGAESGVSEYTLAVRFLQLNWTMWVAEIIFGTFPIFFDAALVTTSMIMIPLCIMGLVILPLGLLEIFVAES